jgi:DNA-binding PadR family transcriptional regulator
MARSPDALSRMDVLVLGTLARVPMHGYELELELRYRHVRWWAKCEHGHLYATLARLEKKGWIAEEAKRSTSEGRGGGRKVFRVTKDGRRRLLARLAELGASEGETYFDVDLFLSGSYLMEKPDVVEVLGRRKLALEQQLADAVALKKAMGKAIPAVAHLIIDHRVDHLRRELRFTDEAVATIDALDGWGPFLGTERISDFVARTGVELER